MIYDILTFPVLVFLFPVLFIGLAFLTEASDRYGLSTFIVIFTAIALQLFSNFRPFDFIVGNILETIFFVIGWFLVGCVYATIKWWIYVSKAARRIREYYFLHPSTDIEDVTYYLGYDHKKVPFQISDHKAKITGWISFWIFSLLGTFINDILLEFANWLYSQIGGVLQKISNNAFHDFK